MPSPSKTPRPTEAELEILQELWQRGPSTVKDVHQALEKSRGVGYTTVLKLMQIMAQKGLVKRNEKQRAHVYEASQPQERMQKALVSHLVERVFGGSAARLALQALSAKKSTPEELAAIRRLLDEHERGEK